MNVLGTIQDLYDLLQNTEFNTQFGLIISSLAASIYLLNMLYMFYKMIFKPDDSIGYGINKIIGDVFFLFIIFFSHEILSIADGVLVSISDSYSVVQAHTFEPNEDLTAPDESWFSFSSIYKFVINVLENPLFFIRLISLPFEGLVILLDYFIYPFFLIDRFFILGLLRFFFPIIITFALLDFYRDVAMKFFKFYLAVYMLVPAFFLVNAFNGVLRFYFTGPFLDFSDSIIPINFTDGVYPLVLIFLTFVKIKLFMKATSFTFKIFNT